jgi:quercetin dioxygenase-like cupin family protein
VRLIPELRFEKLGVFAGARSLAIYYRNQAGRSAVETFEIGDTGRVVRAAAHHALNVVTMPAFPAFLKSPANRIAASSQFTDDVEGYVFDGADGSQVALWTARADRVSTEHVHAFDEYVLVIEGRCAVLLGSERIELRAGQEFVIPKGTRQRMEVAAGTRTMHVFGGKRASRESETER